MVIGTYPEPIVAMFLYKMRRRQRQTRRRNRARSESPPSSSFLRSPVGEKRMPQGLVSPPFPMVYKGYRTLRGYYFRAEGSRYTRARYSDRVCERRRKMFSGLASDRDTVRNLFDIVNVKSEYLARPNLWQITVDVYARCVSANISSFKEAEIGFEINFCDKNFSIFPYPTFFSNYLVSNKNNLRTKQCTKFYVLHITVDY